MLHELLTSATINPPTTDTGTSILGILIGSSAPLIVALTALYTAFHGKAKLKPATPDSELEERVKVLENFLIRAHFNPTKIRDGEERLSDVRFS